MGVSPNAKVARQYYRFDGGCFPAASAGLYLAVRFQSFDRYYFVELWGTGSLRLCKRVDGSTADLGTTTMVDGAIGSGGIALGAAEAKVQFDIMSVSDPSP
jgi:hypothetical protein